MARPWDQSTKLSTWTGPHSPAWCRVQGQLVSRDRPLSHPSHAGHTSPSGCCCCPTASCAGHTSWSTAGLGYLTLWLLGKLRCFDGSAQPLRFLASLLPLLGAVFIGITRLQDYWWVK